MATKTRQTKQIKQTEQIGQTQQIAQVDQTRQNYQSQPSRQNIKVNKNLMRILVVVVVVLAGLSLWWWRTNTWPLVAMVGTSPITRFEVEQSLFSQYGQSVIDGLITQKQIEAELNKQNIQVEAKDIDGRIDEIKKSLGEGADFQQELKSRGLDESKLRELISLQLRLAKAVEGKAAVASEEITAYIKDNGQFLSGKTDDEKKIEAEEILKQEKSNAEIEKWVEGARNSTKVWRLYPAPTVPAGQSGVQQ